MFYNKILGTVWEIRPIDNNNVYVKSSGSRSNFQNFVYTGNVQWGLCKKEIGL
jgi:hypothetical protein